MRPEVCSPRSGHISGTSPWPHRASSRDRGYSHAKDSGGESAGRACRVAIGGGERCFNWRGIRPVHGYGARTGAQEELATQRLGSDRPLPGPMKGLWLGTVWCVWGQKEALWLEQSGGEAERSEFGVLAGPSHTGLQRHLALGFYYGRCKPLERAWFFSSPKGDSTDGRTKQMG